MDGMTAAPTDAEVAAQFESIGRNCEYAFVQVKFELNPVSLLRWSGAPMPAVIDGLTHRFEGLFEAPVPEPPHPGGRDWWPTCARYGIILHTTCTQKEHTIESAVDFVRPHYRFLADKLIRDIENDEKIFLYSDASLTSPHEAAPLFDALRWIGPSARLLVVIADPARAGTAERISDGMICGYMSRLTHMGAANDFDIGPWPSMLRAAWEIGRR